MAVDSNNKADRSSGLWSCSKNERDDAVNSTAVTVSRWVFRRTGGFDEW